MTQLERAVESTWALVLARFVMPAMLTLAVAIGTWYASRIEALFGKMVEVQIEQGRHDARIGEIERRLNGPNSPVMERRNLYGGDIP